MISQILRWVTLIIAAIASLFGVEYTPDLSQIGLWINEYWVPVLGALAILSLIRRRLFARYPNTLRFYAMNVRKSEEKLFICLETIVHKNIAEFWESPVERWEARIRLFFMHRRSSYSRCCEGDNPAITSNRSDFVQRFFRPILGFALEKGERARLIQDDPATPREVLYGALIPCVGPAGNFVRSVDAVHEVWKMIHEWEGEIYLDPTAVEPRFGKGIAKDCVPDSKAALGLAKRIREVAGQVLDAASFGQDRVSKPIAAVYMFSRLTANDGMPDSVSNA